MSRFVVTVACCVAFSPVHVTGQEAGPEKPSLESLSWMAGHWTVSANGRTTEEVWMAPAGGIMLGMNRAVGESRGASFESLRIVERDGQIVYLASPGGSKPTPFTLKSAGKATVIFENAAHDFPNRIIYKREGNQMTARIEGTIGGKQRSMEWTWGLKGSKPAVNKARLFLGIQTVVYRVKDLKKAKEWYADVLGIQPYFDESFYVGFRVAGQELGLDPDVQSVVTGNNQPAYWAVSDCEKVFAALIAKGARADSKPQDVGDGVKVATVIDPFGHTLGLVETPATSSAEK